MNNKRSCLAVCLIGMCLLSVARVSSGTKVTEADLSKFQKGVTTQADVETALGPPQSRTLFGDGQHQIVYVGVHAQAKVASFIPVVGLFAGGATGQTNIVTFTFDKGGLLQNYSSTEASSDVRTGLGTGSQSTSPSAQ